MQSDNGEPSHLEDQKHQAPQEKQDYSTSVSETPTSSLGLVVSQPNKKYLIFLNRFWEWSGFGKKTLWDILQFFAIFIPIILFIGEQREANHVREEDYRREVLSGYLEQMTKLLLENEFISDKTKVVARSETLSTLRQLDGERKAEVLRFLYEVGMLGRCKTDPKTLEANNCSESIFDLSSARFNEITFDAPVALPGIDLRGASLANAKLQMADLSKAQMKGGNLQDADLSGAILVDAQIETTISDGIRLVDAILIGARFSGSILSSADMRGARLQQADLSMTALNGINFQNADLQNANLNEADLQGADLRNADLTGASLHNANLRKAKYNNATRFPSGFSPDGYEMRRVD